MPALPGRVVARGRGTVRVELINSGQILNVPVGENFFIGDPVQVVSENGKISGVTRVSKKLSMGAGSRVSYGVDLGEYWRQGRG